MTEVKSSTTIPIDFLVLLRKQDRVLTTFANAITNFKKLGQARMTEAAATQRLQYLREQLKEGKELDAQLFMAASSELRKTHFYFTEDQLSRGIEDYHGACEYLQGFVVSRSDPALESTASHRNSTVLSESRAESKSIALLPRVELPRFEGEIKEWENFRDRFDSLIKKDSSLTDADRMHYLNSVLKGKALETISHLRVTAANFPIAWEILTDEFDNKRELTIAHLKSLISLPSIIRTAPDSYRDLRARLITTVQSLKNLDRSPDSCFDLVILLATEQFDSETKREWDFKLSEHNNYPSLEDLLKFLQTYAKAGATESNANSKVAQHKQTGAKRKSSKLASHSGVTKTGNCIACSSDHLLYRCDAFRELTVENRFKLVKENNRCINCFSPKHLLANCTNKWRCQECSGLHHTLLYKGDSKTQSKQRSEPSASPVMVRETSSHLLSHTSGTNQVLLPTARVKIYYSSDHSTCPHGSRITSYLNHGKIRSTVTFTPSLVVNSRCRC